MTSRLKFKYKPGTRLRIEFNSGYVYYGDFIKVDHTHIFLKNTLDLRTDIVYSGVLRYSKTEIFTIRKLNIDEESPSSEEEPEKLPESMFWNYWRDIITARGAIQYIKNLEKGQVDYENFIGNVKYMDTIAVQLLPVPTTPDSDINIIVFVTKIQIYVLDFSEVNKKTDLQEIKSILECPILQKVMHNSAKQIACLNNKYKIKLTNHFDTQVADQLISIKKGVEEPKLRSQEELLRDYLDVPSNYIEYTVPLDTKELLKRPINEYQRNRAGFTAVYLLLLKKKFDSIMLSGIMKANNYMLNRTRSKSPVAARFVTNENVMEELQHMKNLNI